MFVMTGKGIRSGGRMVISQKTQGGENICLKRKDKGKTGEKTLLKTKERGVQGKETKS